MDSFAFSLVSLMKFLDGRLDELMARYNNTGNHCRGKHEVEAPLNLLLTIVV